MPYLSERTIVGWVIAGALIHIVACSIAVWRGRLYPMVLLLIFELFFYLMAELDAPCSINPLALYPVFAGFFLSGLSAHHIRYRRSVGKCIVLAIVSIIINVFFCGLDMGLIRI